MKNKIIAFAIAMLLPNLAWACASGGGDSYIADVIVALLGWVGLIYCAVFFIGLIVLNIFLAFKKDQENKRSNWWLVIVAVFLVLNPIVLYINYSSVATISFVAIFIANVALSFKANKGNKKLNWWMVLATVLFVCSFFAIVFAQAWKSALCGSANF